MTVQQISVFVENRPGQLLEFTKLLEENDIDLRALSMAEAEDFGILRVIVDDSYRTVRVLKEAGYVCSVTPVLAVEIPDRPGSLVKVLTALGDGGVNLEYMYAFLTRKEDFAYLIFRVEDIDRALNVMHENGIHPLNQEDVGRLFA